MLTTVQDEAYCSIRPLKLTKDMLVSETAFASKYEASMCLEGTVAINGEEMDDGSRNGLGIEHPY